MNTQLITDHIPKPPPGMLVTLLCPNTRCLKRVAVMEYFPVTVRSVKPGDITLIDGRTAPNVNRLVCPKCFTTFPPRHAAIPRSLLEAMKNQEEQETT